MKQRTADWLAWRSRGIGSSEAPIVTGDSPWATPFELWESKTGRRAPAPRTGAMRRGIALEPVARAAYEAYTGNIVEPHCRIHPQHDFMLASLDGISLDEDLILEIKCPGTEDHSLARAGKVPQKYIAQIQHQLSVTGAEVCHLWSFDGAQGMLVEVYPDGAYIHDLVEAERTFWGYVQADEPPPLGAQDPVLREDAEWARHARAWQQAQQALQAARAAEAEARARLEALAGTGVTMGAGVRVAKTFRKGSIDYGKVPLLQELDLEPYRKPGSLVCTISTLERKQAG